MSETFDIGETAVDIDSTTRTVVGNANNNVEITVPVAIVDNQPPPKVEHAPPFSKPEARLSTKLEQPSATKLDNQTPSKVIDQVQSKTPPNDGSGDGVPPPQESSKTPQVIVRVRPSPYAGNNVFEVDVDTKSIQIRVDREEKERGFGDPKKKLIPEFIYFPADNILENSSQEDTFETVASGIVEKGMRGENGMIVAIGPEMSGKSFSLFGLNGRYRNRGILGRVMEKMFELKEERPDHEYRFGMGIIEIRREKIRDLITLSPHEINEVGDRGPKGMYMEEVDCLEHGLGLMLRALIGQKLIHKESYERYHTIVYLEILAMSPENPELTYFESRLTFAEITAAPADVMQNLNLQCVAPMIPKQKFTPIPSPSLKSSKCCNPGYTTGPLAESIAVRRDIFALEQIFNRASETERLKKYYAKLEGLGLAMVASEKRRLATSHNFRQSRLAHCLKDILDNKTQIIILLHIRQDKAYLKSSLEAMRFAERVRLVPLNSEAALAKTKSGRTEEQILQEVIAEIAPDLMHPSTVESLSVEKMKAIQEQAVQYFESNIDSMKVCTKEKVRHMFENFRILWNFLWELELSVSLKKAEEEMREAYVDKRASKAEVDEDESKEHVGGRKTKSRKKDHKRKKKHNKRDTELNLEQKKTEEAIEGDDIRSNKSSNLKHPPKVEQEGSQKDGQAQPPQPPTTVEEGSQKDVHAHVTIQGDNAPPNTPLIPESLLNLPHEEDAAGGSFVTMTDDPEEDKEGKIESEKAESPPLPIHNSAHHLRHSTFFMRSGFHDFKLQYKENHYPQPEVSGGVRASEAAKLEQVISNNFEEMKKLARRQAIHLLKTGSQRPEWTTLF